MELIGQAGGQPFCSRTAGYPYAIGFLRSTVKLLVAVIPDGGPPIRHGRCPSIADITEILHMRTKGQSQTLTPSGPVDKAILKRIEARFRSRAISYLHQASGLHGQTKPSA